MLLDELLIKIIILWLQSTMVDQKSAIIWSIMATIWGSRWGSSMRSGSQLCSSTPATTFVSIGYFLIDWAPRYL